MINFLHCNILQFITASSYMIVKHFIVFMLTEDTMKYQEAKDEVMIKMCRVLNNLLHVF